MIEPPLRDGLPPVVGPHPRVLLLGIPTRGVTLAARLARQITEFSGVEVASGALDVTLYRDDLMSKPPRPLAETSIPAGGVDDAVVVLVDDVLYSGRTVRAALDALRDVGRVLGLPFGRHLAVTEIQQAFKRAAKTMHPDGGGNGAAFLELAAARDALIKHH